MESKKKMIIIASAILVFSLAVSWYLQGRKQKNAKLAVSQETTKSDDVPVSKGDNPIVSERTVRMTFFLDQALIGSIGIPEWWGGHYRKDESGNSVKFQFIDDQEMVANIFEIDYFSENDPQVQSLSPDDNILTNKDGRIFVLKKPSSNPYSGQNGQRYGQMLGQVDDLAKDFKVIKL